MTPDDRPGDAEQRHRALRVAALLAQTRYLQLKQHRHATARDLVRARGLWVTLEAQCAALAQSLASERAAELERQVSSR